MNLKPFNTLGLPARAERTLHIGQIKDLSGLGSGKDCAPRVILGGGSNVVIHAPLSVTVLLNELKGRSIDDTGILRSASGEDWHELVMWSIEQGFAGLENLALIPGSVGAAPVQNIGAYGVELSDVLVSLTAWDFHTGALVEFLKHECQFGYRDSIFKHSDRQGPWDQPRYFITDISLQLTPSDRFKPNLSYRDLAESFADRPARSVTPLDVAKAVIEIRQKKLPDPETLGNVGSFFKNPIISRVQAKNIAVMHPQLPQYPVENPADDVCKIPAAWLIEQCGFKGVRRGDVGVHSDHALVIVNHGEGSGREVLALAHEIQQAVVAKFGIFLEPEPVFLPAVG